MAPSLHSLAICSPQFLHPLPIAAHHAPYAGLHHLRHIHHGMQMVWHQTELQDANLRIMPAHHIQLIHHGIAQRRALYARQRRVAVRNHQAAQQRLARGHRQRHMIHPDAPPCRTRLLPVPAFLFRHVLSALRSMSLRNLRAKVRNNRGKRKEKFFFFSFFSHKRLAITIFCRNFAARKAI